MTTFRPIKLGFVNAYLLPAGDGFVLVDSGMSGKRAELEAALKAAGCESAGNKPGQLRLVVLTHPDYDHTGNCLWLRDVWKAKIAIHEADAEALETGVMLPRRGIGAVMKVFVGLTSLLRSANPGCPVDVRLAEGQTLADWGLDASVYHLPGHTRGSIGILSGKDFFAGDLVANWKKPGTAFLAESFDDYRASLARVRKIVPADGTVWPGHGGPFPAASLADIRF